MSELINIVSHSTLQLVLATVIGNMVDQLFPEVEAQPGTNKSQAMVVAETLAQVALTVLLAYKASTAESYANDPTNGLVYYTFLFSPQRNLLKKVDFISSLLRAYIGGEGEI